MQMKARIGVRLISSRRLCVDLRDRRQMLTGGGTQLWAGGYGVKPIRKPIDGVCLVPEFQDLYDCLASWRSGTGSDTRG